MSNYALKDIKKLICDAFEFQFKDKEFRKQFPIAKDISLFYNFSREPVSYPAIYFSYTSISFGQLGENTIHEYDSRYQHGVPEDLDHMMAYNGQIKGSIDFEIRTSNIDSLDEVITCLGFPLCFGRLDKRYAKFFSFIEQNKEVQLKIQEGELQNISEVQSIGTEANNEEPFAFTSFRLPFTAIFRVEPDGSQKVVEEIDTSLFEKRDEELIDLGKDIETGGGGVVPPEPPGPVINPTVMGVWVDPNLLFHLMGTNLTHSPYIGVEDLNTGEELDRIFPGEFAVPDEEYNIVFSWGDNEILFSKYYNWGGCQLIVYNQDGEETGRIKIGEFQDSAGDVSNRPEITMSHIIEDLRGTNFGTARGRFCFLWSRVPTVSDRELWDYEGNVKKWEDDYIEYMWVGGNYVLIKTADGHYSNVVS